VGGTFGLNCYLFKIRGWKNEEKKTMATDEAGMQKEGGGIW